MRFATIGVDPGTKATGIALIDDRSGLIAASVIEWEPGTDTRLHVAEILDSIAAYALKAVNEAGFESLRIAVEDVVRPSPHLGIIDPTHVIELARLIGWLSAELDRYCNTEAAGWTLVRPGGHGSKPLITYPAALVGPTETTGTSGFRRHARSAYDIARHALTGVPA